MAIGGYTIDGYRVAIELLWSGYSCLPFAIVGCRKVYVAIGGGLWVAIEWLYIAIGGYRQL